MYKLAAFVLLFSAAVASAQAWNHDPGSSLGLKVWGTVAFQYASCGSGDPTFVQVGRK